jgi:CheY-like chemotaxis protein
LGGFLPLQSILLCVVYDILNREMGIPWHQDCMTSANGLRRRSNMWIRRKPGTSATMRREKSILIVDDERIICDLLAELLEDEGYRVVRAYDGVSGLAAAEKRRPDLILTDVMMPGIDGVTLIRRLRDRGVRAPAVLMSAVYADVDLPHVRFVPKPFDVDDILDVVDRLSRSSTRSVKRPNLSSLWHSHARACRRRQSRLRLQPA